MVWKLAVTVLLLGLGIAYMSGLFRSPPDPPEVGDGWWGRGDKPKKEEDTSVKRFNIRFPDADLADLKERLRRTRWFESVEGTKFHFGIKPEYMKKIVDYWLNKYDWRKKEQELNQYQSYKTKIEGIDIHFVRAVPRLKVGQKAKPILMVHGWPSSFYEFYKIIPMLIDPTRHGGTEDDIFEVIVPSLPGYGFSEAAHKQGMGRFQSTARWRKKEQELNQYQSYKTKIEGIDIHFVRAVPRLNVGQKAKPILMVHGWPSSFYEFYKIIPMLIDPTRHGGTEDDIFEVIVPSLPGYGFSEAAHKQGFDSYYVQGGDWGAKVTDQMAGMFPNHVRGIHVNMILVQPPVSQIILGSLFPSLVLENKGYARSLPSWESLKFWLMETGYLHIQATKPDTVGHALTDSPVGLAAYIIEKFSSWTNYDWLDLDDGGLDAYWSKDDLLTNVMIYWVSECITSSMRLYKENLPVSRSLSNFLNTVPAGLADLPNDLSRAQKNWATQHYTDIVSYTTYSTGGHFAAFEVPDQLAKDLRQFVQKVEQRLLNNLT
ncbi:epoxide hydrolase 1-like [Acanthaster planci]|uniref:Epoxide hydrolase 1-like n=1 Tax=Acanthaster planci TaxID=133434 RepID=A0A8B7Y856_ACAPL|nr:epoxide hydrolase 1-like [Acanthaster planci]